jgi:outer membrane receptor protein involved in Fe transport
MDGSRKRKDRDYNVRAGFEWYMSEKSTISLSGRYGGGIDNDIANNGYNEWNPFNQIRNQYSNEQDNERSRNFFALNSNFTYEFDSAKHRLDADIMLFRFNGGEDNVNMLYNDNGTIRSGQKSLEGGPAEGFNYRVNYVNSFSELINIEMGAQGRVRNSNEWNEMYYYDTGMENYLLQEMFSHESFYDQNIHAGYALIKGKLKKFAYQLGIRGEYTNRRININDVEETFTIKRWDYFPTLHASYKLISDQQLMASYTRRIDRPRSWALEPFYTWQDAYNIRRGNPELEPEYIDSYELGYQNDFRNNSFSVELYYRKTQNLIERIQSVYDRNVMLRTFDNVGHDYSLGIETMFNFSIKNWWENSLNGNFFHYRVEGEINDREFDRKSFSWSVNWNQTFHIAKNTQIQLNPEYEGPETEAQEREKGSFELDGAIRQSLWNNKVRLTLQARDILSTDRYESVVDEPEFYNFRKFWRKTPVLMLNLTWNINTSE